MQLSSRSAAPPLCVDRILGSLSTGAFTAADVFLRRNGFYIEVEGRTDTRSSPARWTGTNSALPKSSTGSDSTSNLSFDSLTSGLAESHIQSWLRQSGSKAHKLARILYHKVTAGHAYDETICAQNQARNRQRMEATLREQAGDLGLQHVALPQGMFLRKAEALGPRGGDHESYCCRR
jgi:hypothetical protein